MAGMKMIRMIELMQQERARFSREHDLEIPENEEIDHAYGETIQLLESFYTRSEQMLHNLRAYGRGREQKADEIGLTHFDGDEA